MLKSKSDPVIQVAASKLEKDLGKICILLEDEINRFKSKNLQLLVNLHLGKLLII